MATRKTKKILMFLVAPLAIVGALYYWFFVRTMRDKNGNVFSLDSSVTNASGSRVLINGSPGNDGYLVRLKRWPDGTVGGVNAAGQNYYWNNAAWVVKAA